MNICNEQGYRITIMARRTIFTVMSLNPWSLIAGPVVFFQFEASGLMRGCTVASITQEGPEC